MCASPLGFCLVACHLTHSGFNLGLEIFVLSSSFTGHVSTFSNTRVLGIEFNLISL